MNSYGFEIVAGIVLLFLGRKLFWVFVGVIGFLSGTEVASQFFPNESRLAVLAIALAIGLLGAILAIFLQKLVVIFAGFLAGVHLAGRFLSAAGWRSDQYLWLLFLLGGILGAILALLLFDWALIILSSLTGAALISQAPLLGKTASILAFVALAIAGILVQSQLIRRSPLPVSRA
jgi:Domain of unknown function (DUF4203)